jgi:hypothetical protein
VQHGSFVVFISGREIEADLVNQPITTMATQRREIMKADLELAQPDDDLEQSQRIFENLAQFADLSCAD